MNSVDKPARIACIGTGLIGRAWAIVFARSGYEVALFDENDNTVQAAQDFARNMLPALADEGLLDGQDVKDVITRLTVSPTLDEAVSGASFIQESTPEDLAIKKGVFSRLEAAADPSAIIASSTSALLPTAFSEHLTTKGRCLVVHPINPPYLVPAVEIVPAPWTTTECIDQTAEFMRGCGMAPIVMKKEIDGFVMNRMQGALLEEAFRLVADGYASIEDIDIGLRDGLALRWSFMGPFETIDLNAPAGVRDYAERYQSIYEGVFPSMQRRVDWTGDVMDEIEADRRKILSQEDLQARQQWRDRRLMALIAHKRRAEKEID